MKRKTQRRVRRRAAKRFKVNRIYLDDYERSIIMSDIWKLDARICVDNLMKHAPDRYDKRYLAKALIRLSKQKYLKGGRTERVGFGKRQTIYRLPEANRKAA